MSALAELTALRAQTQGDTRYPDDRLALLCCDLALEALAQHNYGVGAVVVDVRDEICAQAGNAVFGTHLNSAGHAEMRALDQFEASADCSPRDAELFVLLEPCPMCAARALYAGLRAVRWVIPDPDGGMLHRVRHLPPAWRNLAELQHHSRARVSPAVQALCEKIAHADATNLRQQWREHMGLPASPPR